MQPWGMHEARYLRTWSDTSVVSDLQGRVVQTVGLRRMAHCLHYNLQPWWSNRYLHALVRFLKKCLLA
jgi:hypothetical protein